MSTQRRRRKPQTERGRKILAFLDAAGLSIRAAADRAKVHQVTIARAIHGDPSYQSVSTVEALLRLGVPLELAAPTLMPFLRPATVA